MSKRDEPYSNDKRSPNGITNLTLWKNEAETFREFRQLNSVYHKTMESVATVVNTDIAGRFDRPGNHPDVSALFYKGAIQELVRAAVNSVGEQRARSILRQVSQETKIS